MIIRILTGWQNTPEWTTSKDYTPITSISVIVAARNEAPHIKKCIESIIACDFPTDLLEIIVIDDASTDNTAEITKAIKSNSIKLIKSLNNVGKKGALALGIKAAHGSLIITTDADCHVQPDWLKSLVSYYEKSNARLIAAPIQYDIDNSLIQRFQYIDGINNMAVTANGIMRKSYFMANGANLAYEKSLFEELNGFEGSIDVASGDDMYMIQSAAKKNPDSVHYLKSKAAIVSTKPEDSLSQLLNQRKRWATKTKSYSDKRIIRIQGYVFFLTLLLLANLFFSFAGSTISLFGLLVGLSIKLSTDFFYLKKLSKYFHSKNALRSFLPASLMFIIYILTAGWWALFPSTYQWKGRKLK